VDDYSPLHTAPTRELVRAARRGYVTELHAELIGRAKMLLGAGRRRVEDVIDPGVGGMVLVREGDAVKAGDPLIELHYRDGTHLPAALDLLRQACVIGDAPPAPTPLVLETVG
jgi:pyrimidine-nucleoside phosphorylase